MGILSRTLNSTMSAHRRRDLPERCVTPLDEIEFPRRRPGLSDTDILKDIRSKPHWRISISPTHCSEPWLQGADQCRNHVLSSSVIVNGWLPYPFFWPHSLQTGDDWISGEIDWRGDGFRRSEHWVLFQNGQFQHCRAFDEITGSEDHVHLQEIVDAVTGAFEFAARMAQRGLVSPEWVLSFELCRAEGTRLVWRQGRKQRAVGRFSRQKAGSGVKKRIAADCLLLRRREHALDVISEISAHFGWADPPKHEFTAEQEKRFGHHWRA
jgi:hypothetical protein